MYYVLERKYIDHMNVACHLDFISGNQFLSKRKDTFSGVPFFCKRAEVHTKYVKEEKKFSEFPTL